MDLTEHFAKMISTSVVHLLVQTVVLALTLWLTFNAFALEAFWESFVRLPTILVKHFLA